RTVLCSPGCAGFSQSMRSTMSKPCLITAVAKPLAEAGSSERLAVLCSEKCEIAHRACGDDLCELGRNGKLHSHRRAAAVLQQPNLYPPVFDVLFANADHIRATQARP